MKEEEKMRLKIRALWIEACDINTHFFHRYASHHKNINTIWEIQNEEGIMISSRDKIKKDAETHFKSLFKDQRKYIIGNQMKVIEHYPSFFSKEEGLEVGREITLDEIQKGLSRFSKYKSTGPDAWNVDLFLVVFDIMGENLLEVVEFLVVFNSHTFIIIIIIIIIYF